MREVTASRHAMRYNTEQEKKQEVGTPPLLPVGRARLRGFENGMSQGYGTAQDASANQSGAQQNHVIGDDM